MGAFDKVFPAVAQVLGRVFGSDNGTPSATLTLTTTTKNPQTMQATTTKVAYPVNLFPPESYNAMLVDGAAILDTDLKASFASRDLPAGVDLTAVVPTALALQFAGKTYSVVSVTPLWSGSQIALYTLQVR